MRNLILLLSVFILPLTMLAQRIEKSEVNPITGKILTYTSWTEFGAKSVYTPENLRSISFMLRSEDEKVFIHFRWYDGVNHVDKDSELLFKMSDGSITILRATHDFTANVNVYSSLDKTYSSSTMHVVYEGDLSALTNDNLIENIQFKTIYGSQIYELSRKSAEKVLKAYRLILDEIK
ncbi:hypothetical protein JGH11_13625 [Dysgonomonas sp. Marseille-P4677]|uniref:hypothetical protein n=1 Tax=Dysgonomonas sp. Marseille-P4677 TaxID=2364790 RepID=UPI0019140865|nr:hypothetical protein [Dysgonomonas sp. Marseille-P4677]MBK5721914.1 hypothetical protein [Dysgonomonas sp. Marseille-P4677]